MTKSLSNKLCLKKQLYGLRMKKRTMVLEHLNFFNKVIARFYLLMSKSTRKTTRWYFLVHFHSYTIIWSPPYSTVRKLSSWRRSYQLSYLIRSKKGQIKRNMKDLVWWSCERKEEEKERKVWVGRKHVTLSQGWLLEEWLQSSAKVAEEEGASCGGRHSKRCWYRSINGFLCWRQHFSR